ncbi:MAG: arylsulfatase, partial [Flavobacteriaceae bacterium]|nr:arylsulfatase [Flavobacteriaceae bacterium]
MKKYNHLKTIKNAVSLAALANIPIIGNSQIINTSEFNGVVGKTYDTSKESWPDRTNPAAGKPNVVWIVLDDVGFGAT